MLIEMTKDIKYDLESIGSEATTKDHQLEFVKHFTEIVQFHNDAKQLSVLSLKLLTKISYLKFFRIKSIRLFLD